MSKPFIFLPDLFQAHLDSAFCIGQDGAVSRRQLLAHVLALSRLLPDRACAINLCQNRYRFMVAYLAAVVRGQLTLLPFNQSPNTLIALATDYADSYCLSDGSPSDAGGRTALPAPLEAFDLPDPLPSSPVEAFPPIDPERVISISFTSGSTGEPKAIAKNWREFHEGALLALRRLKLTQAEAVLLSTVPTQHMYGLETSLFWPLFSNLAIHESRPFYPRDIAAGLASLAGPGILVSTPVHLKACVQSTGAWPRARLLLSATAPLSADLAKRAEHRFKAPLLELFGSTETLSFASRRTVRSSRWRCYDGVYLSREAEGFAVGGGHLPAPVSVDDCFLLHRANSFSMLGRAEDMLKIAGKRASLAELNAVLTAVDGIEDGVFIDADNERLTAIVVSDLSKKAILAHLKLSIDPVFLPRRVIYVPKLPRNGAGKVMKSALRELVRGTCIA